MCNEVFKGIQIVSASNYPETQYCAGGFVEHWRRGRCLLLTQLTPECSVRPSHWLLLPRSEPVVWSQHRPICLQDNNMFTAPASHECRSYRCFQGSWRCREVVAEEDFVKGFSGGTELGQDLVRCGGVAVAKKSSASPAGWGDPLHLWNSWNALLKSGSGGGEQGK